jgi:hypothetical protein
LRKDLSVEEIEAEVNLLEKLEKLNEFTTQTFETELKSLEEITFTKVSGNLFYNPLKI